MMKKCSYIHTQKTQLYLSKSQQLPHPGNGNHQLFLNISYPISFLAVNSRGMEPVHGGEEAYDKDFVVGMHLVIEGIHSYPVKMKNQQIHMMKHAFFQTVLNSYLP